MLGIWKESNFLSTHEIIHFRDDSMRVPLKVEAVFLPFQTIFIITAFAVLILSQMGNLGLFSLKGACYTQATVYYRVEE